jgi:predicted phage terminase large subunit-like protein
LTVNVSWPCFLLGNDPSRRIISASYSSGLAVKHSIDSRAIINSRWYQKLFPNTNLTKDQNEKDKFLTTERGFRLATSVGGTLTGEGGNYLILDDPHNPAHIHSKQQRDNVINWYEQVFASRLDDKNNGVIIIIMQRLHPDDLSGYLISKKDHKWFHLNIPAISNRDLIYKIDDSEFLFRSGKPLHPARENLEQLNNIRSEIGEYTFNSQYLQNPKSLDNGIIKRKWLKYMGEETIHKLYQCETHKIFQSWDTAIKNSDANDYSVCTSWIEAEGRYYLIDIFRDKLEYPDLKKQFIKLAEKFSPDAILIEDKATGQAIIQDLKREINFPIIPINPTEDKITRAARASLFFESEKIFIKKELMDFELESELLSFPNSRHDDQVDSITQFINWIKSHAELSSPRIRNI